MRWLVLCAGLIAVFPAFAANGKVSFLGVGIQEINADRAKQLALPEEAVRRDYVRRGEQSGGLGRP